MPKCIEQDCNSKAIYGADKIEHALHCSKHRNSSDLMWLTKYAKLEIVAQASHGYVHDKIKKFCGTHANNTEK
jgi:hypothetical protein